MIYTAMTKKAMRIAYDAHKEQVDKCGTPYIFHPVHLAEQMDSEEAVIVALLHDVVEDTDWTMENVEEQGFSEAVINALTLLTHGEDVDYLDYVRQIQLSADSFAKAVKLADLRHNSDLSRFDQIDEKALSRVKKYAEAIKILEEEQE